MPFLLSAFFLIPVSWSAPKSHIEQLFERLWSLPGAEMKIERTIRVELLSQTQRASGRLLFSRGRVRMTLQKPSPSELVFDGQTIWHAQELGADLGGGWQVAKAKDAKSLQSNGFLRLLFGDKNVFQELKLISREERSPEILAFKFEPLPGKDFASINRFVIEMNRPRMTLTKIDYTDENGNRIVYDFLSFRRRADLTKSDFSFKPPAGARVTEYQ